jgi:hypothetical protein
MTAGELRSILDGVPDSAMVGVLNTWDGEFYPVEDVSILRSTRSTTVAIETTVG